MQLNDRINSFELLGKAISSNKDDIHFVINNAVNHNGWFTAENVKSALLAIKEKYLNKAALTAFAAEQKIPTENKAPKIVGLVMAGNIPLVGFQDLLYVLLTGNKVQLKLSSKDEFLSKFVINKLIELEPRWKDYIAVEERLHNFDAIIATGSNNSSRYFEYYFSKYPNIIRKNRNSIAVLSGNEEATAIKNLGEDIFNYFGLGCRNVSQVLVPKDYDFNSLLKIFEDEFPKLKNQHKYKNNYDYQYSLLLINGASHKASENLLLLENENIASPISCLHFKTYENTGEIQHYLDFKKDEIQCVVSEMPEINKAIAFGKSQQPSLNDFADNVNVVNFLLNKV